MVAAPVARIPNLGRVVAITVIALAWGIALVAALMQRDAPLHHHAVSGSGAPTFGTILLFLVAWQVMTAAMMLPSSLPLVHLFVRASRGQERPRLARAAFLAGYFAVWTWFALMALAGDAALHWFAQQIGWLRDRP